MLARSGIMRRCVLILNARAGAALAATSIDALAENLARPFRARGDIVTIICVEPKDLGAALAEGVRSAPDILLVAGGDGTQRTAGRLLQGSETALGVIPLGTLNVLAQMLGIPRDPAAAADALATAEVRPMDAGEINGEIFLCNSIMGLTLVYSEERARLRGAPLQERVAGYFALLQRLLTSNRRLEIAVDDGAVRRRLRAISAVITNNPYRDDRGLTPERASLDGGVLALYVARHESGWRLARGLARMAWTGKKEDPRIEVIHAHRLVIEMRRREISLSNDGEVEPARPPLRYAIRPRALKVLVPRESPHAASAGVSTT